MDTNTALVYQYQNLTSLTWTSFESTSGSFRQLLDWGSQNIRNRIGIYLIADPLNAYNIRFFFTARTAMPGGPTGAIMLTEPIVEEVDANNRQRRTFFVGHGTPIYAEPACYQTVNSPSLKLYAYQVTGLPVKYFGLGA